MKRIKFLKKIMILFILSFVVFAGGCANKEQSKVDGTPKATEKGANDKNPIVTIEMEDGGVIKVELYPEIAPNTVRNFVSLVQSKFYDGVIFHRVIPNFMIQGGDPDGTGGGGPGYSIKGEFSNNGFDNALKHEQGVISMGRVDKQNNSAGSQFFIMVNDVSSLDGDYASFGKVTEGMETVDKIVSVETGNVDKPTKDQKMKNVIVDTFGVKYGEVEKIK
ncbi:MAG: peptidyl-prolyl cis-trans isomerase B (cyclophilin B) [Clostridium sp.]|jgi:peptidyl-prolyl cis-trans isomerase B (cyclophilin B)